MTAPMPVNRRRIAAYVTLVAALAGGAWLVAGVTWLGNSELRTLLETIATLLGFMAGAIALVRYYSRKSGMFLLLGTGFVGAALLDLHDAGVTFITARSGAIHSALTAWSGTASCVFLSTLILASGLAWRHNARNGILPPILEPMLFLLVGGWAAGNLLFFALVPLPNAYFQLSVLDRPGELVPGVLFALAAVVFLWNGNWRTDQFEHWLILSLITAACGHLAYLAFSTRLYDAFSITAQVVRIVAYLLVLTGLFLNMLSVFRSEAASIERLNETNLVLAKEADERQRAEESLRRSRDELEVQVEGRAAELVQERQQLTAAHAEIRSFLASVPSILIGLDSMGRITRWNPTASQIFGIAEPAVLERTLDNCGIRWLLPEMKMVLDRWLRAETLLRSDELPFQRDMEKRWVGFSVQPLFAPENERTGFLITGADITERKQMNEALHLSEERFRLAAENASDVILELDYSTGRIEAFGSDRDPATKHLPRTMEELRRMLHPDDRERVLSTMQRMKETGEPAHEEYRLLGEDGTLRYWSTRGMVIRESDGRLRSAIGVFQDITPRKVAEARLSHLAAIVESSESAIVSLGVDGNILTWNTAAERLYGYRAEEMLGRPASIIWPPEEKAELAEVLQTLLERGEAIRHREGKRVAKDGRLIPLLVTYSPLRDATGKITGTFSMAADLTERKLLERQLAQAQKLESIGQLAAGIAHEINTPIQYVGDNLHFISDGFKDQQTALFQYERLLDSAAKGEIVSELIAEVSAARDAADLEYLEREIPKALEQSLDGVARVATIVRAMKTFAHPGGDEKMPADLNQALSAALIVSRNEIKYVADVVTDFGELPPVWCNLGDLNQVFLNLLVNAAHAIADVVKGSGGRGKISLTTRCEENNAIISISDTGCGIPAEIQSRVFDPFFTTKELGMGTGQGLAMARNIIVKQHAGKITFEPNLPRGTTFVVSLPIDAGRGASKKSTQPFFEGALG